MTLNKSVVLRCENGVTFNGENYADFARSRVWDGKKLRYGKISTTKLRGIYGLIMNIYSRINAPEDFEGCKSDIQYLKVKMAYEAGRDQDVKEFIKGTYLMALVAHIDSYEKFILYCRYAESLVAYTKFFEPHSGGKE